MHNRSGPFVFLEDELTKPFKTIDEQIDILLDRKLIIENIDEAKNLPQYFQ